MSQTHDASFAARHIGPRPGDVKAMLKTLGLASLKDLVKAAAPEGILSDAPLDLPKGESEAAYLEHMREMARRNKVLVSCIGQGYTGCITPAVIRRCVLENPAWYTPYTPYQAEIAQGRLEALLNFQTMMADLAGMEVANASLLDEATAAAEAMTMLHRIHHREHRKSAAHAFFVADTCFPQTLAVLRGRAEPLGIEVVVGQFRAIEWSDRFFGALVQFPDAEGNVCDYRSFIEKAHAAGVKVAVAADPLALTVLTPPGEFGADVVVGSAQRFGVPMGYGGPHAAFFATREAYVRELPGRIIGVSVDRNGEPALRMALQTREQHIRREKAKSNICTAQALLANIASFYGVYHGPEGLKDIAMRVHRLSRVLDEGLRGLGFVQTNPYWFDTVRVVWPEARGSVHEGLKALSEKAGFNLYYPDSRHAQITLDETTTVEEVQALLKVFAKALGGKAPRKPSDRALSRIELVYHDDLIRTSPFMTHPVFHAHRSETGLMRYMKALEDKDLGLSGAMIPLGSCTMKLNAAAEMEPVTWPEFANLHPFAPVEQARGYMEIFGRLEAALREVTGFAGVSLQPNAGSQGELAGLMVIRAYHAARGEGHRNIALIPSSAHGTNPASAVMAGMEVEVVACDSRGNIDLPDLDRKIEAHRDRIAALMVTYPSTFGVFDPDIVDIIAKVHAAGGQVYMDGANMNAQVGITSPGRIGADVCHLNLHKTFSIPHGGGGPGMGPICVAEHLIPFLPGHPLAPVGGDRAIAPVAAAPWGSSSILLISYGYIRMLGSDGMAEATRLAILGANYLKRRLENAFPVPFTNAGGWVAHEVIFDVRPFKDRSGVDETDLAKRLMDYGFHAPTVSWPIPGTMMVEPTESEPKEELDRFCDALLAIRAEIQAILDGHADRLDNPLKNAPHTARMVSATEWTHPYTREQAAYPDPGLKLRKFWPSTARIDNPYGDRNLICSCPPLDAYEEVP
ncbi:MAG TPA: aminomethyl-transferring glycine dehydrogenase [Kiritimatiellia bacterium]|nr:aminomethyl-transferring glycine dehydrogenase [Kiritimatiellia bacterium]